MDENKRFVFDPSIHHFVDTETNKEYCEYNIDKICDLLNEYDDNLQMSREKALYWRNKAEDIFGDMKTNVELDRENRQLEKENRLLKISYAKCRDCKHANMYSPDFAFLVIDPKCELNIKTINSDTNACEDFELIGRIGR